MDDHSKYSDTCNWNLPNARNKNKLQLISMAGEDGVFIISGIFSTGALLLFIYLHYMNSKTNVSTYYEADIKAIWSNIWVGAAFLILACDFSLLNYSFQHVLIYTAFADTFFTIVNIIMWGCYLIVGYSTWITLIMALRMIAASVRGEKNESKL